MWQIIPVRDSDGQPCIGILAHALKVIHTLPPEQGALADALCLRRNRLAQPRLMSVDRWRSDVLPLEQRLAQLLMLSAEVERQTAGNLSENRPTDAYGRAHGALPCGGVQQGAATVLTA